MINELFTNIEALIIMYSPILLTYITQAVDWIFTFKKFKSLDLSKQLAPIVDEIKQLKEINSQNDAQIKLLTDQNVQLRELCGEMANHCSMMENSLQSKLDEQNKILSDLVQENIKLKAQVRKEG